MCCFVLLSIWALDHMSCACVCVRARVWHHMYAGIHACVCGLNTALYCYPNHCVPKGTSKVMKVTLFCRSKHRLALYFDNVFHRQFVSLLDVSQYWIFIQCAHEMSVPVNNTYASAKMSLLPMEDFYFSSTNSAMLTALKWRFDQFVFG